VARAGYLKWLIALGRFLRDHGIVLEWRCRGGVPKMGDLDPAVPCLVEIAEYGLETEDVLVTERHDPRVIYERRIVAGRDKWVGVAAGSSITSSGFLLDDLVDGRVNQSPSACMSHNFMS
jgi:hypothetical protein